MRKSSSEGKDTWGEGYEVPKGLWQVELEIKRSKFITFANQAPNREQADGFIRDLRQQHPQANHVCWAYIAGDPNTTIRSMSDDGEPSGTAGMPMLKVLEHSGLGEVVVAVVRYFGGTKLGTGGLQRAYSDAVNLVLQTLPTERKVPRDILTLTFDYSAQGAVSRLLARYDAIELASTYSNDVQLKIAVPSQAKQQVQTQLMDLCAGQCRIKEL
jgi:uncharacterized YigZ family protein